MIWKVGGLFCGGFPHTPFSNSDRNAIEKWVENYNVLKSSWLLDAQSIVEDACEKEVLKRMDGKFVELDTYKEKFLNTLDMRHFSHFNPKEWESLGAKIIDLYTGATRMLPSVRLSSLCFWYSYIEMDKSYTSQRNNSDIGDHWQMSLIPYCTAFTIDNTMYRLITRIMSENPHTCEILNRSGLELKLRDYTP